MKVPLVIIPLLVMAAAALWFHAPAPSAGAQDRGQIVRRTEADAEPRTALVIGNGAYTEGPLANPVNDARDVAAALRQFGFEVLSGENRSHRQMEDLIREFGRKIRKGGIGMFYFAGHGVQVGGANYLIPIGAQINGEAEVKYEAMDVGFVLAQMEAAQNRLNIVVLDACRNNPFARSFRSPSRGLASIDAPVGTLIAYATAPGHTASDGGGRNGLYTKELLAAMQLPGLKLEDVFKRARSEVRRQSNNQQIPWEASSIEGDFYFSPHSVHPPLTTTTSTTASAAIPLVSDDKVNRIKIKHVGNVPGLDGDLNPKLDSINRTYIYGDNIALNEGQPQPLYFEMEKPFWVEDSKGNRFELKVIAIDKDSSVIEYKQQSVDRSKYIPYLDIAVSDQQNRPILKAKLQVFFDDGTYLGEESDNAGRARVKMLKRQIVSVFCAHEKYSPALVQQHDANRSLTVRLTPNSAGGSIICNSSGYIPGLSEYINPIKDSLGRTYLSWPAKTFWYNPGS